MFLLLRLFFFSVFFSLFFFAGIGFLPAVF